MILYNGKKHLDFQQSLAENKRQVSESQTPAFYYITFQYSRIIPLQQPARQQDVR